jgi:hypothetical protein
MKSAGTRDLVGSENAGLEAAVSHSSRPTCRRQRVHPEMAVAMGLAAAKRSSVALRSPASAPTSLTFLNSGDGSDLSPWRLHFQDFALHIVKRVAPVFSQIVRGDSAYCDECVFPEAGDARRIAPSRK